ncbi:pentapeptide repeat-containing protein [Aliterella atlantica]|uniref:pentapeptide repeat-containing protein n=1 Tax=Aliterella atlantica TaxID=1827278 RepID=UPI0006978776|nr:pentapeptide repeat-containing protein [Aliterella atlantica]
MASEQHITLLRQGFRVWNKWRQQNPQSIPELKGADLRGLKLSRVDLSGVDLSEADFSGTSLFQANLSGANLCKANLSTALLQEADLSRASLIEANLEDKKLPQTSLSGANLSRANLIRVKFYASTNLNKANFSLSNLSGADLSGLTLRGNNFVGANLCKANLNATNLNGANLSGANLSEANLEYANLRGTQIQEATIDEKWYLVWDIVNNGVEGRDLQGLDLSMANLEGANLCEADLKNVNLTGTKFNRANLAKSNLVKANLIKTDLNMANLRMTNLREANLCEAILRGADLSGANLSEANLRYAKLHCTQIQEAIIDEKWYLVWDIINNGAEGRDLSEADLSEADLSEANFKNGNLSRVNFSRSILNKADFSWTDLSGANFRKANLAGANFDWADFNEADLSEVEGFGSITCSGASFSGTSFRQTRIPSSSLEEFKKQGASFNEADISEANIEIYYGAVAPVRNRKEFFENLLFWKNQESFNESLKKSLLSSEEGFIPGILLYTDEDDKLSLYVREHFDALDKLTGDWCTIYLLENPSPKWRQANHSWRKMAESGLNASWFKSKPYDKSEAYDIARQLNVELSNLPCLILISPANLSEKLVLQIKEVSPEYFRKLFSTIEKLVKRISSEKLRQRKPNSQVFDYLKLNFNEIVNFLENHASKQEKDNSTKYILKGDNIFVSIEPVNISNLNYNEKIEGNYVQGNYTAQSRSLTVGNVGGDFKPIGSALMADDFRASGTVANSINFDQGMTKEADLQNRQNQKSSSKTSKVDESKSIGKVVGVIVIVLALLSGLTVYIFFQLGLSKYPVSGSSQEQRIKK